jgi:hypothetical protein
MMKLTLPRHNTGIYPADTTVDQYFNTCGASLARGKLKELLIQSLPEHDINYDTVSRSGLQAAIQVQYAACSKTQDAGLRPVGVAFPLLLACVILTASFQTKLGEEQFGSPEVLGYAARFLVVHGRDGLGSAPELQPIVSWAVGTFSATVLTRTHQAAKRLPFSQRRMALDGVDVATQWWQVPKNKRYPMVVLAAKFGGVHLLELCKIKVRCVSEGFLHQVAQRFVQDDVDTVEEQEVLRGLESVAGNVFVFPDADRASQFRRAKVQAGSKYGRGFPTIYTVDGTRLLSNGITGGSENSLPQPKRLTVVLLGQQQLAYA